MLCKVHYVSSMKTSLPKNVLTIETHLHRPPPKSLHKDVLPFLAHRPFPLIRGSVSWHSFPSHRQSGPLILASHNTLVTTRRYQNSNNRTVLTVIFIGALKCKHFAMLFKQRKNQWQHTEPPIPSTQFGAWATYVQLWNNNDRNTIPGVKLRRRSQT